MRRRWLLLLSAVLLGGALYFGCFQFLTSKTREMNRLQPDVAWLIMEYRLSPAQAEKIAQLNAAYRPICDGMCARIASQQNQLADLLAASHSLTPEITAALQQSSRLDAECRAAMLDHIYKISREMDPKQSARYLAAMRGTILQPGIRQA